MNGGRDEWREGRREGGGRGGGYRREKYAAVTYLKSGGIIGPENSLWLRFLQ